MVLYDRYFAVEAASLNIGTCNIISEFWEELGHLLLSSYLDTLSLTRLWATERQLCRTVGSSVCEHGVWLVMVEVTPELRTSSAMRARYAGSDGEAHLPVMNVSLPHKNLVHEIPTRLSKQAMSCRQLSIDFAPVLSYQDLCSHSSLLTGDPWRHVVLRLLVDAALLDHTLKAVHRGFPNLQVLRLTDMPSFNLGKQVVQLEDGEEPLGFLVLRQLIRLRSLKVLVLQSARSHPNWICYLLQRAFEYLVNVVLPTLALQELSLSTLMVQPDSQPRRSVSEQQDALPMPLKPFLQLHTLQYLQLSAVRYQHLGGPVILNFTSTPCLKELHLSFYVGHEDASTGGVMADSKNLSLSSSLRCLSLNGLGPGPSGLRPGLAKSLASCPCLETVRLSGPQLQADFFNELTSFLDSTGSIAQSKFWTLEWTCIGEGVECANDSGNSNDSTISTRLGVSLARWGGGLQLAADQRWRPDLRMTCERVARLEQKPTAGLRTFGDGMEWFLGGRPPGDMSMEQRAVINNRYNV